MDHQIDRKMKKIAHKVKSILNTYKFKTIKFSSYTLILIYSGIIFQKEYKFFFTLTFFFSSFYENRTKPFS